MAGTAPFALKINLLGTPFGVLKDDLSFSFQMGEEGENTLPAGYRLVFADCLQALREERYLLDTGMVADKKTCGITVAHLGQALAPDRLYVCRVQTKSAAGRVSGWSEPLWFSTAPEGWDPRAVWAAGDPDFCLLRREFSLSALPAKALLQVTARSPEKARQYVYHIRCNGEFVGLGPARYGCIANQPVLYYETMELTPFLKEGRNCLAAACYTPEDHCFTARLILYDADGRKTAVFEDAADFEALDATALFRPAQSVGTDYYPAAADNLDGEQWPYGWDECLYTGGFARVQVKGKMADGMRLCPYPAPVVERFALLPAVTETMEDGRQFVDLGKEIIGGICLHVASGEACELCLRYGEELTDEGRVRYQMRTGNVYEEHWRLAAGENHLSSLGMKAFRYVEIEGLPEELPADWITGFAYRTAFDDRASYFTGSSELLNTVYDLCKYTVKATNQNLFVDSQSRERCAYEGDVLINMLTAAGVEDCHALARFSIEYLLSHRTWPAEYVLYCILMARLDYEYTGDAALLRRQYPRLKECLYLSHWNDRTGLIHTITMAGNVTDAVLVDWPPSERDGYAYGEALYNTVFNAVHYRALEDLAYLAGELGQQEDRTCYSRWAQRLKQNMIQKLYRPAQGGFIDGLTEEGAPVEHMAQHATAFALYAGVYDSVSMRDAMAAFLAQQGEIRMSVYGAFFLLEGLYAAGAGGAANALLLSEDCSPGARTWAYMLDKLDATITTEAWNTVNKPNMTWSHPWGSAAGSAIVRGIFGIRPVTPGFGEFSVRLQPEGLRYAALQVPTVKGAVLAAFDCTFGENALQVTLTVPAGTVAHIALPGKEGLTVYAQGTPLETSFQEGFYCWQTGSGTYMFELKEKK